MSDLAWMRAVAERIEAARRDGAPEEPADGMARQVVFQAGAGWYALPLDAVREVVLPRPPFARVPGAPAAVRGAMNLRGRVVAVVELAALIGGPAEPARRLEAPVSVAQQHVVLLDRHRARTGLLVGAVVGVETLPLVQDGATGQGASRMTRSERMGVDVELLDPDALETRAAALFGLT